MEYTFGVYITYMRIKLILDPWAGRGRGQRFLPRIRESLGKGNLLDISLTKGPGEAILLAQEAARKNYDIVVAGGGDGTFNEVINGILRVRSDLPVGFIPLGLSNNAAYALGLSKDSLKACKACEIILKKKVKRIDLGKVTKPALRYFLTMADYGYAAAVVHDVESKFKVDIFRLKSLMGKLFYWINIYLELFKYKFPRIIVKADDIAHEGRLAIVSNSGCYLGDTKVAPQAKIDDGYLDIVIFKKGGAFNMHRYFYLGLLSNRLHALPDVEFHRAKKVSITSPEKVPGSIDGEPFGFTPAEIEVAPQILPVIVS